MTPPNTALTSRIALLVVCAGSILSPFNLAAINVAIPAMAADLQADASLVSWMPTIFLMSNVALMLPVGKLADNFGRKRVYVTGLLVNAVASTCAAFATSIEWVLVFRFIQGGASAMVLGTAVAIITSVFPANKRGLPIGINSACIYVGLTLAPAAGGLITETWYWRAVFLVPAPVALVLVALTFIFMKSEWRNETRTRFDWQGALLFAAGTSLLVVAFTGLPDVGYLLMLIAALVLLGLFIWHQSSCEQPLIRWQMFTESRMFTFSLAAAALMYASAYPLTFLLSLDMQYIRGLSPSASGQVILVQGLAMAILAPFAGKLSDRIEPRLIATLGCVFAAAGFLMLAQLNMTTGPVYIAGSLFMIGIGMGLFTSPNNNAVMSAVDNTELGVAAASMNLARVFGNLVGMSMVNLLVNNTLGDAPITPALYEALEMTVGWAIIVSTVFVAIAAVLSSARGNQHR